MTIHRVKGVADRVMTARWEGRCPLCGTPTRQGQKIARLADTRQWCHLRCALALAEPPDPVPRDEAAFAAAACTPPSGADWCRRTP